MKVIGVIFYFFASEFDEATFSSCARNLQNRNADFWHLKTPLLNYERVLCPSMGVYHACIFSFSF